MESRRAVDADRTFPPLVYVAQGTAEQAAAFFAELWPEARVVAEGQTLWAAFGLGRGGFSELFGTESIACGLRAAKNGFRLGMPVGDPRLMPGAFLLKKGEVIWEHRARHAGDRPEWGSIPR